jgi:hypothetical protein
MIKQRSARPAYVVTIDDDADAPRALRFTFAPSNGRSPKGAGRSHESPTVFSISVRFRGDETQFNWISQPTDTAIREELEAIARQRIATRNEWIEKLRKLVTAVKGWADEFDWATRIVEKKIQDAEIGNYTAPALVLQKETVRLFLEPIARTAPGADGVVDLCLMPAYDDIASLFFYNNRWNVHYVFGEPGSGNAREAESKPLTKATLRKLFDEMKAHAG